MKNYRYVVSSGNWSYFVNSDIALAAGDVATKAFENIDSLITNDGQEPSVGLLCIVEGSNWDDDKVVYSALMLANAGKYDLARMVSESKFS